MINNLYLYKSVSIKKEKNKPIVVRVIYEEESYVLMSMIRDRSTHTGNKAGLIKSLAFSPLITWSEEE